MSNKRQIEQISLNGIINNTNNNTNDVLNVIPNTILNVVPNISTNDLENDDSPITNCSPFASTTSRFSEIQKRRKFSIGDRNSPIIIGNKRIFNMNNKHNESTLIKIKEYYNDVAINKHYQKFHDKICLFMEEFEKTEKSEFIIYNINIELSRKHSSIKTFEDFLKINNFSLIFDKIDYESDVIVRFKTNNESERTIIVTYGNT